MTERYVLEKIVESCKSMTELTDKLDSIESKLLEYMLDVNADGSIITIGLLHYEEQLSMVDNDGRLEPIVKYVDQPWAFYNIIPPKGFIFK